MNSDTNFKSLDVLFDKRRKVQVFSQYGNLNTDMLNADVLSVIANMLDDGHKCGAIALADGGEVEWRV